MIRNSINEYNDREEGMGSWYEVISSNGIKITITENFINRTVNIRLENKFPFNLFKRGDLLGYQSLSASLRDFFMRYEKFRLKERYFYDDIKSGSHLFKFYYNWRFKNHIGKINRLRVLWYIFTGRVS